MHFKLYCRANQHRSRLFKKKRHWKISNRCQAPGQVQDGGRNHGERGARAYNGGLGLCFQWGPKAKPQMEVQGATPPEADEILVIKTISLHKLFD